MNVQTIIGKNKIKEALNQIELTKDEYHGYEIDNLILKYYNLPEDIMLEDVTEPSHEFDNITEVYDYIDEILISKGYTSTDLETYIRR